MLNQVAALLMGTAALPKHWDPTHPVPQGITSSTKILKLPISSSTHLTFITTGVWDNGTLSFSVRDNQEPPSYNLAVTEAVNVGREKGHAQLGEGESFLEVKVEARYSDKKLWEECTVLLGVTGEGHVQLRIETPMWAAKSVLSQLAFHVAFYFPPSLHSIEALTTRSGSWRTLGDTSFASLYVHRLDIKTNNAGLRFDDLRADDVSLGTTNGAIEGNYDVNSLEVHTTNRPVSGTYQISKTGTVRTTNNSISGSFRANRLKVSTSNGTIEGDYYGVRDLTVSSSNRAIRGEYKGNRVEVTTSNATILARIYAQEARLQTSNSPIDLTLMNHTLKLEDSQKVTSTVDLELFASTSNAPILVVVEDRIEGARLKVELRTSNREVSLRDPTTFSGSYDVTTSNAVASFKSSNELNVKRTEEGTTRKIGTVEVEGAAIGSIIVSTSNATASVVVG